MQSHYAIGMYNLLAFEFSDFEKKKKNFLAGLDWERIFLVNTNIDNLEFK